MRVGNVADRRAVEPQTRVLCKCGAQLVVLEAGVAVSKQPVGERVVWTCAACGRTTRAWIVRQDGGPRG